MSDLIAFLRARLDEDEQAARRGAEWLDETQTEPNSLDRAAQRAKAAGVRNVGGYLPARVLRDVEAKRRILDWHSGGHECSGPESNCLWITDDEACATVRALAEPYADHPDYQQEWRP